MLPSSKSALLVAWGSEDAILTGVLKATGDLDVSDLINGLARIIGLDRFGRLVRRKRDVV